MSNQQSNDAPLFQNTDDQERAYAPEELADGGPTRAVGNATNPDSGPLPAVPVRGDLSQPVVVMPAASDTESADQTANGKPS